MERLDPSLVPAGNQTPASAVGDESYTATAIPFIYSFSGNSAASAPISTFMCL